MLIPAVELIPIQPVGHILILVAVKRVLVLVKPINYTPVPAVDTRILNHSNIFMATKPTPIPVGLIRTPVAVGLIHIPVAVALILNTHTDLIPMCRIQSIVHTLTAPMEDHQDTPSTLTSQQTHLSTEVIQKEREHQKLADHQDS